jgi:hypothetical protein
MSSERAGDCQIPHPVLPANIAFRFFRRAVEMLPAWSPSVFTSDSGIDCRNSDRSCTWRRHRFSACGAKIHEFAAELFSRSKKLESRDVPSATRLALDFGPVGSPAKAGFTE